MNLFRCAYFIEFRGVESPSATVVKSDSKFDLESPEKPCYRANLCETVALENISKHLQQFISLLSFVKGLELFSRDKENKPKTTYLLGDLRSDLGTKFA